MSASRRRSSRRRSKSSESQLSKSPPSPSQPPEAAADDLPELEASDLEELEELQEIEEFEPEPEDMRVRIEASADGDTRTWSITLKKIEKPDVIETLGPSIRNLIGTSAADLRWQHIVARFEGETLIPSALKEAFAEWCRPASPRSVTLQRGYGDEVVLENAPPKAAVHSTMGEAGHLQVEIDVADVPFADLDLALAEPLGELAQQANGRALDVRVSGPSGPLAERLQTELAAAGALRLTVDDELLMDRELEGRIQPRPGDGTALDITLGASESELRDALQLCLPKIHVEDQAVTVRTLDHRPNPAERTVLANAFGGRGAARLVVEHQGEQDLVLPSMLLASRKGSALDIQVDPGDRTPKTLGASFDAEVAGLAADVHGRRVTVDWPADFELDDAVEQGCLASLTAHGPTAVTYTFAGKDPEPAMPIPLTFHTGSSGDIVGDLDTDVGSPAELARATARRLRVATDELRGQRVELHVHGSGALSRSLRRALREGLDAAGVPQAELVDRGETEFLLPRAIDATARGSDVTLAVTAGPRDPEQLSASFKAEIEQITLPEGAVVTLAGPAPDESWIAALEKAGATRVSHEGSVLFPPLLAISAEGSDLQITGCGDADDAALVTQASRELSRELDRALASAQDVSTATITWDGASPSSAAAEALIAALVGRGIAEVYFDDGGGLPLQVHPEPAATPAAEESEPSPETTADAPASGDPAAENLDELPELEEVDEPEAATPAAAAVTPVRAEGATPVLQTLGTRPHGSHPLTMLAVSWSGDLDHEGARQALSAQAATLRGHRVLLVPVLDGAQVDGGRVPELLNAAHSALGSTAGALLAFRAARGRKNHFAVVASRIDGLPTGARLEDPRSLGG